MKLRIADNSVLRLKSVLSTPLVLLTYLVIGTNSVTAENYHGEIHYSKLSLDAQLISEANQLTPFIFVDWEGGTDFDFEQYSAVLYLETLNDQFPGPYKEQYFLQKTPRIEIKRATADKSFKLEDDYSDGAGGYNTHVSRLDMNTKFEEINFLYPYLEQNLVFGVRHHVSRAEVFESGNLNQAKREDTEFTLGKYVSANTLISFSYTTADYFEEGRADDHFTFEGDATQYALKTKSVFPGSSLDITHSLQLSRNTIKTKIPDGVSEDEKFNYNQFNNELGFYPRKSWGILVGLQIHRQSPGYRLIGASIALEGHITKNIPFSIKLAKERYELDDESEEGTEVPVEIPIDIPEFDEEISSLDNSFLLTSIGWRF